MDVSTHAITGMITASGNSLGISTAAGNLVFGTLTSSSGITVGGAADINLNGNVTATGALSITTGATNTLTVAGSVVAAGSSVAFSTATLADNGTITATAGNLAIQSSDAGNALAVLLGAGAQLNANFTSANVTFNATTAGAIIGNSGNGAISAGNLVNYNGGVNAVNVAAKINGTITATGNPVNISTTSGNLSFGALTSGAGMTLSGAGNIDLNGPAVAIGASTVTSGSALTIAAGGTQSGSSISDSATNLTVDGSLITTGGVITLNGSSNVAIGGALSAPGATLSVISPTITITGAPAITAGQVGLALSGANGSFDASALTGITATNLYLGGVPFLGYGGSNVTLTGTGNLSGVSGLFQVGAGTYTATGSSVTLPGTATANLSATANLNTGSVTAGTISASATNLTVDGSLITTGGVITLNGSSNVAIGGRYLRREQHSV